jgi:hypothetical protein
MRYPEDTFTIEENVFAIVAGERIRIKRIIYIGDKALSVISMEPPLRTEPKKAGTILQNLLDAISDCTSRQMKGLKSGAKIRDITRSRLCRQIYRHKKKEH